MLKILITIHIFVTLALVAVILIQRTSSDGLAGLSGGGGGGLGSIVSSKASANFLTKITAIFATIFIINSLVIATITARKSSISSSIIEEIVVEEKQEPTEPQPINPSVPIAE